MNTPTMAVLQLDCLIQLAMRQGILEALQKPGLTLDQLTQTLKLYQKTMDQELKAKASELKKRDLDLKAQKLAADQEKEARKQDPSREKPKPAWPHPEAILHNVREQKRLEALEEEEEQRLAKEGKASK